MGTIKNIVFDLGNVLVSFKPLEFLIEVLGDRKKADECYTLILQSPEWKALDEGLISIEDAQRNLIQREPSLATGVEIFYQRWMEMFHPIEENVQLLEPLKQRGYRLYVLSNIIREVYEVFQTQLPFFDRFDGIVASCEAGMSKPNRAIYEHLLHTFNLTTNETLFIDDLIENVEAARAVGIASIQCQSPAQLRSDLEQLGILNPRS